MKSVLLPAALAIVLAGCSLNARKRETKADPPPPAAPVAQAAPANLARQAVLTAEFRPFQEVDVHAKVAGYLKKIYVDVGDHVKQGQMLALLEVPEMADDVARAKATTQLSGSNVTRARDDLERAQSAHAAAHLNYARLAEVVKTRPNLVAQQEIDDAEARDRVSEAQVSAAQAALQAAEQQVDVSRADQEKVETLSDYMRITAPFTGVITDRYADTGALIQAGTASQTQAMPVVRLSQNDLLRLVLPVPESMVPRIHLHDSVQVRVPTLNRTFEGRIARFADKLSLATRTMETEVDVPNPSLVLIPGMYAEAVLTLERRSGALAVPVAAVSDLDTNPSVMLIGPGNTLELRQVKTGIVTPDKIEILSGLNAGDLVVVGSRSQFRAGEKVDPKLTQATVAQGS
ncbi:MAG TPA: efflux RND transporter periplasmic adaptor subunit [Bryobacteraceae bacterium]|nr:efflux RND transporter periplasmic adaptor subunit [Bryobacteraceae bacterium]